MSIKINKKIIIEEMPFEMDVDDLVNRYKQLDIENKIIFDNSKFNFKKAYNKSYFKNKYNLPDIYCEILEKYSK
jgi:hypothetical protein